MANIIKGDKVVVPAKNLEGVVTSVFPAGGNEYVLLEDGIEAHLVSEVYKVNSEIEHQFSVPMPLDVNQPVFKNYAAENYDIDKDERSQEFKDVHELEIEELEEDSIVLTNIEKEMITNTLENVIQIIKSK